MRFLKGVYLWNKPADVKKWAVSDMRAYILFFNMPIDTTLDKIRRVFQSVDIAKRGLSIVKHGFNLLLTNLEGLAACILVKIARIRIRIHILANTAAKERLHVVMGKLGR